MATKVLRRRFTLEEYHRMGEAGILGEDDRVELIEGEILEMSAIGPRHAACVDRLTRLFFRGLGDEVIVRVQNPVNPRPDSEPQPDITLLRSRADFYSQRHPGPDAILLIVEVAEASLDYDRGIKHRLYARSGIQELWIVDLEAETVEVCREPVTDRYRDIRIGQRGETVSPGSFPDLTLRVDDILG